ncbi:hypothetical protein CSB11_01225 [Candidatus Campbellbacteria bacterium]|nr:MAG: hypothetical protein CSB11_01225 [Candidatus Campbellbacteria bacterium]
MNKKILIGVLLFWFSVIGGFVGYKEYTVQSGTEVLLKTRGYDPHDIFRGEYVRLRHNINEVGINYGTSNFENLNEFEKKVKKGDRVFVSLKVDEKNTASVGKISLEKPKSGIFIKGKSLGSYYPYLKVDYGLGSYFVEEGKGYEIEKKLRDHKYSAFTKVSINRFGDAVILDLFFEKKSKMDYQNWKDEGSNPSDF